jgi:RND family efflux transporter MFP subunit
MYMHLLDSFPRKTIVTAAAILAGLASYPLLAANEAPSRPATPRLLEVTVAVAHVVPTYTVSRSYVGRVESARRSELAFEVPGLISQVIPEEGDSVVAGQTIAVLDSARLRSRRAALEAARDRAKADLELSQLTADRLEVLVGEDVVSPQKWDETRKLRDSRDAELRRIESEIATVDVDLEKSVLRAPYSGQIARRYVDEGSVVRAGERVARLLETTRLEVRVGVAETDAMAIAIGSQHTLRISGRDLEARVRSVLPERGPETRAVEVILQLANGVERLRDGDLAELAIRSPVSATGLWLPMSALSEGARGLWSCYVAEPLTPRDRPDSGTHRLARRQLELLHEESDRVFVRGTLRDGERVVVEGTHRLVSGQKVRVAGEEV